MDLGTEERRLAIEIIATLAHLKNNLVEFLLVPAGLPREIYAPILKGKDSDGRNLSKRQMAPLFLAELEKRGDGQEILRALVRIASEWDKFHLADNEFAARATVQKARELFGVVQTMQAREKAQRELARKLEVERLQTERYEMVAKQCDRLLMMFDALAISSDHNGRGLLLQDLLNQLLDTHSIPVVRPFVRNFGGEQIDGAFKLDGWHYLVECRWRAKLANIRELDGLRGQIGRSGKQTMGVFLSIEGWSDHVPNLLKQNPDKSIILMDGYDLRTTLSEHLKVADFISAKVAKLSLEAEPFLGAKEYLLAKAA